MKNKILYFLIGLVVIFLGVAAYLGFFESQEMAAYDWLMRTRPIQASSPEIVIIEISDDTLQGLGRWPLSREYHAALINALTDSGCSMIVFDVMFSESTRADGLLAQAMRNSGKVYFPSAFRLDEKRNGTPIVFSKDMLGGVAEDFKPLTAGMGHINVFVDGDGKIRKLPLWVRYEDHFWPSLGFLVAARHRGVPLEKINIPVDSDGNFWVNYPGEWVKTFKHFSYLDVLKAQAARQRGQTPWLDLAVFKDKICFVGLTAAGTSDFRANPIDTTYPLIGTQVSVCDSILRQAFIKRAGLLPRIWIDVFIFIFCFWLCLRLVPVKAFVCCFLLAFIYVLSIRMLFNMNGSFSDVFLPLISILLAYVSVLLYKFFEEVQKRRLLEKELEIAASIQRSFLPPELRNLGDVQIRALLRPAKFVGGDFYDIIPLDESRLGIFIGDVSGKGISAALIMAQGISLFRIIAGSFRDPGLALAALNSRLMPILNDRFITGQYIIINQKECFFQGACAGHPSPILFNNNKNLLEEPLSASGPPLGLHQQASYVTVKVPFNPGDKIFMYTDGWTENRDLKGNEFGIERVKDIVLKGGRKDIDVFLSDLQADHDLFKGKACQYDDLTALVIEFKR